MKKITKAITFIVLSSLCAGFGQLAWKKVALSLEIANGSLNIFYTSLLAGIILYSLATIFMILSFREGELSMIHPFLATSFIWVTLISPLFFKTESISFFKLLGSLLIFSGVSLIGIGGSKK